MYEASAVAARLVALSGEVWVQEGGDRLSLAVGSLLDAGQIVQTGSHSEVQLLLSSGHELALGPEQSLLLDADVLADAGADTSQWTLAAGANAAAFVSWFTPGEHALVLEAVLDHPASLDHLLGSAPMPEHNSYHAHELAAGYGGGDDLAGLLRSLYGPSHG